MPTAELACKPQVCEQVHPLSLRGNLLALAARRALPFGGETDGASRQTRGAQSARGRARARARDDGPAPRARRARARSTKTVAPKATRTCARPSRATWHADRRCASKTSPSNCSACARQNVVAFAPGAAIAVGALVLVEVGRRAARVLRVAVRRGHGAARRRRRGHGGDAVVADGPGAARQASRRRFRADHARRRAQLRRRSGGVAIEGAGGTGFGALGRLWLAKRRVLPPPTAAPATPTTAVDIVHRGDVS